MNAGKTLAAVSMVADFVGAPPGVLHKPCPSNVASMAVSKEPDAARAMIAFMTSPEAAPRDLRRTSHS
jgi:ABC-type glycerol-3-phosphate transport system substrate-binding protein